MRDLPMALFSNLSVRDAAYEIVMADLRRQRADVEWRIRQVEEERGRFFTNDSKD